MVEKKFKKYFSRGYSILVLILSAIYITLFAPFTNLINMGNERLILPFIIALFILFLLGFIISLLIREKYFIIYIMGIVICSISGYLGFISLFFWENYISTIAYFTMFLYSLYITFRK